MPFQFKTEPRQHQREMFESTKDLPSWGHLWEMGLGKSKIVLDVGAYQYLRGSIDTLLVIAPNGVHRNWITDEVPRHLADVGEYHALCYYSKEAATQRWLSVKEKFFKSKGLLIVAMSYDALLTPRGYAFVDRLLNRRVMLVLDESQRIKNPDAKRTKKLLSLAPRAVIRRILSGTPITNSPFDAWSQFEFLQTGFWASIQCRKFIAFKRVFGIFQKIKVEQYSRSQNKMVERDVPICVGYRDVQSLNQLIGRLSDRKTKDLCLDLPPKVYTKIYIEMTADQRRMYKELKQKAYTYSEDGDLITGALAMTKMIRFQQIVCGFVVTEDQETVNLGGSTNPRIAALLEVLEDCGDEQVIVWARFNYDVDLISSSLDAAKISHVTYDGRTKESDRGPAIDRFRSGDARVFVAKASTAGEGLTLTEATQVVYYSNTFRLSERLQSEDRCHRIGQDRTVTYTDLVTSESIDEKIVSALRDKRDLADLITGDSWKEWI